MDDGTEARATTATTTTTTNITQKCQLVSRESVQEARLYKFFCTKPRTSPPRQQNTQAVLTNVSFCGCHTTAFTSCV